MNAPSAAVFVSYASQDAQAASRLCAGLRGAAIEVWLDQSELQGGDAWDRQIRDRIQACRLFIPVISANTQARDEGYFRREWKLAVDRTDDLAEDVPFLLPIVIDQTAQAGARVPRRFLDVQWLRLPDGVLTPEAISRISRLLAGKPAASGDSEQPALPAAVDKLTPDSPPQQSARQKQTWLLPVAVILGTVILVGAWLATRPTAAPSPVAAITKPPATPNSAPAPEMLQGSLAVLPFVDMSEQHNQEYFADGMSEELSDLLAQIPELSVIGRTSSFQFKGRNVDLKSIGSQLGARYVVEGSVRKSGNRIRITAQLIDTRSGTHLWSDKYDRDVNDTLQLQEQIATSIARALQLAITSVESGSRTRSLDAYTLFLRGRVAFDRGDAASFLEAQEDFEQALEEDPGFVRASEGVMLSYLNRVYIGVIPNDVGWPHLQELAEKALQQNPNSTVAHAVLAWVHYSYTWDWSALNAEIDHVLAAHSRDSITL